MRRHGRHLERGTDLTGILQVAKLVLLLVVVAFFGAGTVVLIHLDGALVGADRALNSMAMDVHASTLAFNDRLEKVDPLLEKAATDLDSLDAAIKAHRKLAANLDATLRDPEKGLPAILVQARVLNSELNQASIEERASLAEQNRELAGAIGDLRGVFADVRAAVKDPAIHDTLVNLDATTTDVRQAVNDLTHPPKATRGQKALKFILEVVFGNAVRGAVTR